MGAAPESGPSFEWLVDTGPDAVDGAPSSETVTSRVTRRALPAAWLGLGLVALVVWVGLGLGAGEPGATPETADPPDTAPGSTPAASPLIGPGPGQGAADRPDPGAGSIVAPVDGLPAVRAVLTSPTGQGARLLTVAVDGAATVDELPRLSDYAFDPSGRWLAGLGTGKLADRRRTLWVGSVDGPLEPLAVGVRTFAWHDDEAGVIAWSTEGESDVSIATLDGSAPTRRLAVPVDGRLRGLGWWGLAIETSFRDFETAIVEPDGAVVRMTGRYRGRSADGRLLFGGGLAPPLSYSPSSGRIAPIPWLDAGDDLWSVGLDPEGAGTVAVVTRDGNLARPVRAEVVRIGPDGASVEGRLDALTPVALGAGGAIVVARQQVEGSAGPGSIELLATAQAVVLDLPDVLPGVEWVAALAVG